MPLEAVGVGFRYTARAPYILHNLSLAVEGGERLGVVAPSGYGKTTLVKVLAGYEPPSEGRVLLDGSPLPTRGSLPVQLIGQHPEQAVNPRWRMRRVLQEAGLPPPGLLEALGIEPEWLNRYPRELSGGELQRFCVARALCARPRFLIADEMSTMLDVITQAQIWHTLLAQAEVHHMGLVVVTHNPALAARVCTRVVDLRDINRIPAPQAGSV